MAIKKDKQKQELSLLIVVALLAAVLFYVVYWVGKPTDGQTHATPSTFLSKGDDIFSLEKDLDVLQTDPVTPEVSELQNISD